ncbi:dimethyladenosine transferase 2, mitochondrial [Microplitis mediator]|uniref:dimethyladenosine transferase 2, mitochondrial n=1 Tax=Microplitis mediator TaxID=375433 RepID=UPI002553BB29|nr:dimethyladenosine transferase 2, mitochondrial [Microplitis mediator]XP_057337909.1 dimethyladenosine transferase 2, mitochondrial [Microplitis mediator]
MSVKSKTNMIFRMFVTRIKQPPETEVGLFNVDVYTKTSQPQNLPCYSDTDLDINKNDNSDENTLNEKIAGNKKVIQALIDTGDVDLNYIPRECLKKVRVPQSLHLLNKTTAKEFSSMIVNDVKPNIPVLEMNPGPGFLTEELLRNGVSRVYLYERLRKFDWYLDPLVKKYGNRVEVRHHNILSLQYIEITDLKAGNTNMQKIFEGIEKKQWHEEPAMQIVGAVSNGQFLSYLPYSMLMRYLSDFGRVILYIATRPSVAKGFEDNPDNTFHRAKNVFLRTFFDFKFLGSLPRESFYPFNMAVSSNRHNYIHYLEDNEKMSVIRLESKKDLISDSFTKHDAIIYFYFLKLNLRRRDSRIIPSLEKWIPGCGRQLIRHNLNIHTRFAELTSFQLFMLFKIVKSWPQFETSSFLEFVKPYLEKET